MANSSKSIISIGGRRACKPLAKTDFPVPRPPAIITPPKPGSTAASIKASFKVPWPVIAAKGKARLALSFTAMSFEVEDILLLFNPLETIGLDQQANF